MSLAIKYETVDDANMRLRNTVVLYKGNPVLIKTVVSGETTDDILRVLIQEIPVPKNTINKHDFEEIRRGEVKLKVADDQRKYISSKHFDIAPFRMGYVNSPKGNGAFYCCRMPNRIQKQGLCAENFQGFDNFGGAVPFGTFLSCEETVEMITNKYPTFDQAVKGLDKVLSVAFSRDFCIVKDEIIPNLLYIYHKGYKVGMHTKNTGEVVLGAKFACLKEGLQEMKVKVGAF